MSFLSHPHWFRCSNYIWRVVQVMKLFIAQFSSASCSFIPLRFKYSTRHPVPKHLRSVDIVSETSCMLNMAQKVGNLQCTRCLMHSVKWQQAFVCPVSWMWVQIAWMYQGFSDCRKKLCKESESQLLHDWRLIANQFVLASSPLRLTTNFFFQLNPCDHSPYVTSSLTRRWVCLLWICLAFGQLNISHI
jgi:hypothetical protein